MLNDESRMANGEWETYTGAKFDKRGRHPTVSALPNGISHDTLDSAGGCHLAR